MPKSPEWTRSKDTGLPWQNPPNAPIFVNISIAAVWYIIKKASANFGKRTVLYRVPRIGKYAGRKFLSVIYCKILQYVIKYKCKTFCHERVSVYVSGSGVL